MGGTPRRDREKRRHEQVRETKQRAQSAWVTDAYPPDAGSSSTTRNAW